MANKRVKKKNIEKELGKKPLSKKSAMMIMGAAMAAVPMAMSVTETVEADSSTVTLGGNGNPLKIDVGSEGSIGAYLNQNGNYQHQYFSGESWATNFFLTDNGVKKRYTTPYGQYYTSSYTSNNTAFGSTTQNQIGNTVVNTWQLEGGNIEVTQTIQYLSGENYFTKEWKIKNVSSKTFSDLRWIHGGDTYFGGQDSALSYWDPNLSMVYVKNQDMTQFGLMGFYGGKTSPADRYFGGNYWEGSQEAADGLLSNKADNSYQDAGYQLQWNRANLAPGEIWTINAVERWTPKGPIQVIAPSPEKVAPGSTVSYQFLVQNFFNYEDTLQLSASSSKGWATNVREGETVTVGGGGLSKLVTVDVVVPADATGTDDVTLNVSYTDNGIPKEVISTVKSTVDNTISTIKTVSLSSDLVPLGNQQELMVDVVTANVEDGTQVTAEVVNNTLQSLSPKILQTGIINNNSATLALTAPSTLAAGQYFIKVNVDGIGGYHATSSFIVQQSLGVILEDTTNYEGTKVSEINPDGRGIIITNADNTNGQWQYSLNGAPWTNFSATGVEDAALLGSNYKVRFIPKKDWNGTATLSFVDWTDINWGVNETKTKNHIHIPIKKSQHLGAFGSTVRNTPLIVTPVNDTPSLTELDSNVPGFTSNINIGEGATATKSFKVSDVDGDNLTVSATSSNTVLVPNENISISGTGNDRTITINPVAGQYGTSTITVAVTDDEGAKYESSFEVKVTPPQGIFASDKSAKVIKGLTQATVDPELELNFSYTDYTELEEAKVVINNFKAGDELHFTNQNGVLGSYNPTNGVLTLSGTTSIENYQQALRSVEFSTKSSDTTDRDITFTIENVNYDDGDNIHVSMNKTIEVLADNLGFEEGFIGWTKYGSTTIGTGAVYSTSAYTWTVNPYDSKMAVLIPAGSSGVFQTVANDLMLSQESRNYLLGQFPNTTNFGYVYQDIELEAGEAFSMSWNYISTDYENFNDGSFVSFVHTTDPTSVPIVSPGMTTDGKKVQAVNSEVSILGATNQGTGVYSTKSYGSTGWQTATFVADQAGTYRLGFTVFNLADTVLPPYLFVDKAPGTTLKNGTPFGPIEPDKNPPPAPGAPTFTVNTTVPAKEVTVTINYSNNAINQEYSLDGEIWFKYEGPVTVKNNGIIYARITDEQGKTLSEATYNITNIDNIAPDKPSIDSLTTKGGKSVTITSTAPANGETAWLAPAGTTTFVAGPTMTQLVGNGVKTSIQIPSAEGSYKLYVVDQAGNVSEASDGTITVDNTAPDKPSITGGSVKGGTSITITAGIPATGETAWLAPEGTTNFTENDTMTKLEGDGSKNSIKAPKDEYAGPYKLYVVDAAGNISLPSDDSIIVDDTAPAKPVMDGGRVRGEVEVEMKQAPAIGEIAWLAPADTTNFVEGETMTKLVGDGSNKTILSPKKAGGPYKLYLIDEAGNISEPSDNSITVDNTAPAQPSVANTTVKGGTTIQVTLKEPEEGDTLWLVPKGATEFNKDTMLNIPLNANETMLDIQVPNEEGMYVLYVVDDAGNISEPSENSITVDNTKPTQPTITSGPVKGGTTVVITSGIPNVGETAWLVPVNLEVDSINFDELLEGSTITKLDGNGTQNEITVPTQEGTYKLVVVDVAGNISDIAENNIIVDNNAPTITQPAITSTNESDNNLKVGDVITISFGADEVLQTPTVKVQGQLATVVKGDNNQWTATYTLTGTETEGSVTISIDYMDEAGNSNTFTDNSLTFDKTAPSVELSKSSTNPTNGKVTIAAIVSDTGSGIAEKKYAKLVNLTDVIDFSQEGTSFEGLMFEVSEGGTYVVWVKDNAGNTTQKTIEIDNIDKVAPTITLTADKTDYTKDSITITAQFNEAITVKKWVKGNYEISNFPSNSGLWDGDTFQVDENGTYTVYVEDAAGNKSVQKITINNISKTAPEISITVPEEWTNQSVLLNPTFKTDSPITVKKLGGGNRDINWFATNGTVITDSYVIPANGEYTLYVKDAAGNEAVQVFTIDKIDKTAPTLTVNVENTWTNKKAKVNVTSTDAAPGSGLDDTIKWAIGDRPASYFEKYGSPVVDGQFEVSENGIYTVYTKDKAGNEVVQKVNVSTIDSVLPSLKLQVPTAWTNDSVTILTTIGEKASPIVAILWAAGEKDAAFFENGGNEIVNNQFTVNENGTYTVYIRDASGNEVLSYVTIDKLERTAPTINLSVANSWTNGQATITADISDSDSGIEVKKWAKGNQEVGYFATNGINLTSPTFSVEEAGVYTVYAKDKAGNELVKTIEVTSIDKTAPEIAFTTNPTEPTNGNVTISVTATDENGSGIASKKYAKGNHPVSYFKEQGFGTGFADDFTVSENGTYTVYVIDNAGNASVQTIDIQNINQNAPTILLTQSSEWVDEQATITAQITGTGTVTQKWLLGEKTAADFNNGTVGNDLVNNQFFPETNGIYTVYAKDVFGNETVSTITVQNIDNDVPTVLISAAQTEVTNKPTTIVVDANDNTSGIKIKKYVLDPDNTRNIDWFKIDGNGTTFSGSTFDVLANGNYKVYVEDFAGHKAVSNLLEIKNIDLTGPTISLDLKDGTNEKVDIEVTTSDDTVVTKWAKGSKDLNYFKEFGNELSVDKVTITENGTYSFYARDKAGNETIETIEILSLGKEKPVILLNVVEEWSNSSATIQTTIQSNSGSVVTKKWAVGNQDVAYFATGGTNIEGTTFTVSENGTYTVYAKDNKGNETVQTITVSEMDKEVPSLELTSENYWTNKKAVVSVTSSDAKSGIEIEKWAKGSRDVNYFKKYGNPIVDGQFEVTENDVYTVYVKDNAGNEIIKTIVIETIETEAPLIQYEVPTSWSNKEATIFTNITDSSSKVNVQKWAKGEQSAKYFTTQGNEIVDNKFTVSENGIYTIYAQDEAGNESTAFVTISTIEKQAPIIALSSSEGWSNGQATIQANITDADSGIMVQKWAAGEQSIAHFLDHGTTFTGSSFKVSGKGIYTVYAKDKAGNESVETISIGNIDLNPPQLTVTVPTGASADKVVIGVAAIDGNGESGVKILKWVKGNHPVSYFKDYGNPVIGTSVEITENGTYTFYAQDNAGNEVTKVVTVNNIETEAPIISVTQDNVWTNSGVTVTTNITDPTGIKHQKWVKGEYTVDTFPIAIAEAIINNSFSAMEAGIYTIYAEDTAGNKAVSTITVSSIDKVAPQVSLSASDELTNGSVEVTLTVSDDLSGVKAIKKYAIGEFEVDTFPASSKSFSGSSFTVTENGTYTVLIEDEAGNQSVASIVINTINNEGPSINYTTIPSAANASITVETTIEDAQGVAVQKWAKGNQTAEYFGIYGTIIKNNQFVVKENGDYTIYAKDTAGNVTVTVITIEGIDLNYDLAVKAVEKAELFKSIYYVEEAQKLLDQLNPSQAKDELQDRLNIAKEAAENFEESKDKIVFDSSTVTQFMDLAESLVGKLPETEPNKKAITDRFYLLKEEMEQFNNPENNRYEISIERAKQYVADNKDLIDTLQGNSELKTVLLLFSEKVQKSIQDAEAKRDQLKTAMDAVTKAEQSNSEVDLALAQQLVDKLENSDIKTELLARIEAVQQAIDNTKTDEQKKAQAIKDAIAAISKLPSTGALTEADREKVEEARAKVDAAIQAGASVDDIVNIDTLTVAEMKLDNLVTEATVAIVKAEGSRTETDIYLAQKLINKLKDGKTKTELQNRLDKIEVSKQTKAEAINAAEKAIAQLPSPDQLTEANRKAIQNARVKVDLAKAAGATDADIANLVTLEKAESKLAKLGEEARLAVETAEQSKSASDIARAIELINKLANGTEKTQLQNRIEAVKKVVEDTNTSEQAKAKAKNEAIAAISSLPAISDLTYADLTEIEAVREKVNAAIEVGVEEADIPNLATLKAAENKIASLNAKKPSFNIDVKPSSTEGGPTTISLSVKEQGSPIILKKWLKGTKEVGDFENAGEDILVDEFTVPEDGEYTLYAKDKAGNEIVQTFVVKNKPYEITGSLSNENGLKATATISLAANASPTAGKKYVIFQLMKGTTPVSVVAIEKSLQNTETVSAFFNVTGPEYKVIVNVLNQELSNQSDIGRSLAAPKTLEIQQ